MNSRIKIQKLLFIVLFIMSLVPFLGAYIFFEHVLQTSLAIGFNNKINDALELSSSNLKKLRQLDPINEEKYHTEFSKIKKLQIIYSKPDNLLKGLWWSFNLIFVVGLLGSILLAGVSAYLIARRISIAYNQLFLELNQKNEDLLYLKEIAQWQQLAQVLAHEIKNPLTPIEILISTLLVSFEKKSSSEFKEQLLITQKMVNDEVYKLKTLVNQFSDFSDAPQTSPILTDFIKVLRENLDYFKITFASNIFNLVNESGTNSISTFIDSIQIRQLFINLIHNANESNPSLKSIEFTLRLQKQNNTIILNIQNSGQPIGEDIILKIWDPYFSTKAHKSNKGLGLPIVKKIALEHKGSIEYQTINGFPTFILKLAEEVV